MFNISLNTANVIYTGANILLIGGAVLSVIGAFTVFWAGGIRERFADERISSNEAVAQTAKGDAAKANREAAEATARAEEAKRNAADVGLQAAQANERAAHLEKDAAQAHLETEKLKALVSWREILPENKERFRMLTKNLLKGQVIVSSIAGNSEAANFARQISEMLKSSGYNVSENFASEMTFGGTPPTGVILKVKSADAVPLYAGPLQQSLKDIGIDSPGNIDGMAGDSVVIFVGNKP
jgi:hypothetical protein